MIQGAGISGGGQSLPVPNRICSCSGNTHRASAPHSLAQCTETRTCDPRHINILAQAKCELRNRPCIPMHSHPPCLRRPLHENKSTSAATKVPVDLNHYNHYVWYGTTKCTVCKGENRENAPSCMMDRGVGCETATAKVLWDRVVPCAVRRCWQAQSVWVLLAAGMPLSKASLFVWDGSKRHATDLKHGPSLKTNFPWSTFA